VEFLNGMSGEVVVGEFVKGFVGRGGMAKTTLDFFRLGLLTAKGKAGVIKVVE